MPVNRPPISQVTADFQQYVDIIYDCVIKLNAKTILEVGTDLGDSTRIFATALNETGGYIWTVDIKPPQWSPVLMVGFPNVHVITSDIKDLKWDKQLDILFLDSDHHYQHVLTELDCFGKWVRKNGLIILHDTHHSEFGTQITQAMTEYASGKSYPIKDYPFGHGLGIIEVTNAVY